MKRERGPLVCYALAANPQEAQRCAWDVYYAPDNPEDAEPFTVDERKVRLYRVTITAKRVRSRKKKP